MSHRDNARRWAKKKSDAEREIKDDYPPVENWDRRMSCKGSLRAFGQVYNPGTFCLPCSKDHEHLIECLEEAILYGAMHARAMPRGSGKSSWCQAAVMWGFSYHPEKFSRYAFLIAANDTKADENLDDIKEFIELDDYSADFPEIAYTFIRIERDARKTLLYDGEPIRMEYKQKRLIFPILPPPPDWRHDLVPVREDGLVPSAGGIMVCCGITAKDIRGSKKMQKGSTLRPGLVLLDDVQDDEVAVSPTQIERYKRIINRAVMGMAGSNKRISIVAPCTCIAPNDVASWLLDKKKNPHFRGETSGCLKSMPKNLDAWEAYFEIFRACQLKEDYQQANDYFVAHQDELLEGAEAAWPESIKPPAVNAVQAAMHEYCIDRGKFFAEDMNQPLAIYDPDGDLPKLNPDDLMARINQEERGIVPTWANTLTCDIDVHDRLLYYTVSAWGEGFSGAVVDYGTWPRQPNQYLALRDANPTMFDATKIKEVEGAIYASLTALTDELLGKEWKVSQNGVPMRIAKCLVDIGYKDAPVFRFCRESKHASILLGKKGVGITAGKSPMSEWKKLPNERREAGPSPTWSIRQNQGKGRYVIFDTNYWKTFVTERLLVPLGVRSNMMIFGKSGIEHRLYADHLCSEFRVRTQKEGDSRRVDEWCKKPGYDNHYFDTTVGTAVAASMGGITLVGAEPPKQERRKASRQDYEAKRAAFERRRIG